MSTLTFSHLPVGHNVFNGVVKLLSSVWTQHIKGRIRFELEARAAISELEMMDDRRLDDLGISRGEIKAMVRGR